MVRVRSLRTQQRAKSQCTCTTPSAGGWAGNGAGPSRTDAKIASTADVVGSERHSYVSMPRAWPAPWGSIQLRLLIDIQRRV